MIFFANCGNKLTNNPKFCPSCGTSTQQQANTNEPIVSNQTANITASTPTASNTMTIKLIGWISVAFSLLLVPILFAALSVIMGYMVKKKGEDTHGTVLMIVGVAAGLFGVLIGAMIGANNPVYY
ncbi:hypothetical protein [Salisediminibacterium halotolerans]|nr:hypothetical protein [Salisediminibacterium halotolerans]RLJ72282.1 hypothetical protein BCL39_2181 [Actinophytocola xinjiangensis]RPE85496.1 hypothetical protein EDD67_2316 [Salisediminibacterium halotolerans]TWG33451.1 hypothetical protein BCL52_2176 [Salisediminibacterium halotolerans]GEL07062.1 zinc ribbon domain-containing protein [Salisediminibacterium halotolerans]